MNFKDIKRIREYQPVIIQTDKKNNCFFIIKKEKFKCFFSHLLYSPCLIGLVFEESMPKGELLSGKVKLFPFYQKESAILNVIFDKKIHLEQQELYIFNVTDTKLKLNIFEKQYVKRIFNHGKKTNTNFIDKFDFSIYKKFVGIFSVPRVVFLVSIKSKDKLHCFPIDLVSIQLNNILFGVRSSNSQMNSLKVNDIFYSGVVIAEKYREVYSLGKFLDDKTNLGFEKKDMLGLTKNIYKLQLIEILDFETQKIYISKIISLKKINNLPSLFHIHKIWYLKNKKHFRTLI